MDMFVYNQDDSISELTGHVVEMGTHVETMLADVVTSVRQGNVGLANSVASRDSITNNMHTEIDRNIYRLFAGQLMTAEKIRHLMSSVKITNDLERIGDLCEAIALRVEDIEIHHALTLSDMIDRMGRQIRRHLAQIIDAYNHEDPSKAVEVWINKSDINAQYVTLFNTLLATTWEDSRPSQSYKSLLFIAKNLERIGDHVTNIAESIYYAVYGSPLIEDKTVLKHMPVQASRS